MKISLSVLMVLLLNAPFETLAKSKKLPNCLKSIVLFSKSSGNKDKKKAVTGTGFIIKHNEKLCVATNLDIIYSATKPKILTIDGNELKYSKILIPKDRRNVVLFEIDLNTPSDIYKTLELDLDVSEDTDIDDSVVTFGCKSNWETVTRSKGKISGLGPVNIEIESKVPYNMNGGPVISSKTGKVIGVLSKLSNFLGEEKDKSRFCKVIRIDSIKELNPLDVDQFSEDKEKISDKEAILKEMYAMYAGLVSEIDGLFEKISSGKGTRNSFIEKLEKKNQEIIKKIKTTIAEMKSDSEYSMQYFKIRHRQVIAAAEQNIKQFSELEKRFKELEKANEKAGEKSRPKGIDLKLDL